jgi:hypothetical protein
MGDGGGGREDLVAAGVEGGEAYAGRAACSDVMEKGRGGGSEGGGGRGDGGSWGLCPERGLRGGDGEE